MSSTPDSETLASPEVVSVQVPLTKWEREYQAFHRLLPQLLSTHRGKYVIVHNGAVVDSGEDEISLVLRFFPKYGNISAHVGLVSDQPTPILHIPHYRPLSSRKEIR